MKVLFMGTPDFAAHCLEAVLSDGKHEVIGVVSQPDRPKGRGHKLMPTAVKTVALAHNITVYQPETLKEYSFLTELETLKPDIIAVVAYGKLLPEYILNYPKYGCINVHGSLLPKYRGAAPIQRAVINGEAKTGVTTMYMEKSLDTGDMILKAETEIGEYETSGELFDRLAVIGGELLVETLDRIGNGTAAREVQDHSCSTYADMLNKNTGKIVWSDSARRIINLIRGTNPWPLAYTEYNGEIMKIFTAKLGDTVTNCSAGEIVSADKNGIAVCCGDGRCIIIKELQFKGGKRMDAASYLNGHGISVGTILK